MRHMNSLTWSLAISCRYYHHDHFSKITEKPRSNDSLVAINILAPKYYFLNTTSYKGHQSSFWIGGNKCIRCALVEIQPFAGDMSKVHRGPFEGTPTDQI